MVMKNKYITQLIFMLFAMVILGSCKKFLEVQPEDKVLETQLFTNKKGIESVLNGLYIALANNNAYGEALTLSSTEILAQRYNIPSTHDLYNLASYNYTENPAASRLDAIWTNSYSNILNINSFLENLERYKGVVDEKTESIYKGEAIALRAYLHFDLFRLYGPRYNTADSTKQSLPYYQQTKISINPLLPANGYLIKVIEDLKTAEQLLKNDAIQTTGVSSVSSTATADFLKNNRNYRLNYFAVKGLQARVFLYRGDKVSALAAAKEVIGKANLFPWTTVNNALSEKINPDRIFSTEMIFGILNTQLYARYTAIFDPAITEAKILAPLPARLSSVFENNENDYRYNLNWQAPTTGIKPYKTFFKYADIVDKEKTFRFTIPLIKISEMYYIAAECEPSATDGINNYLNVVRLNRGLANLATTVNINTELQKEYQKEFYGEGQLFYYYKRRNVTSIGNGSSTANITINYNVPIPLSESQYR